MTQIAQMQKSILHLCDLCHLWLFLDFASLESGFQWVRQLASRSARSFVFHEDSKRRCL